MAYRLEREESIGEAVRRIADKQLGTAARSLAEAEERGIATAVYDARKRIKKSRGLLRFVRFELGDRYRPLDRDLRDAARTIAGYRDAHALAATFTRVAGPLGLTTADVAVARVELDRRAVDPSLPEVAEVLTAAGRVLDAVRSELAQVVVEAEGWSAVAAGVADTYERGLQALGAAIDDPNEETFHDFRKHAKYTRQHLRLLERAAPSILRPLIGEYHNLTTGLGDAHDLALLAELFRAEPASFGGDRAVAACGAVLDGHRRELEARSVLLAVRLYDDNPRVFTDRLGGYWRAWHHFGDERPVGALDALLASGPVVEDDLLTEPHR